MDLDKQSQQERDAPEGGKAPAAISGIEINLVPSTVTALLRREPTEQEQTRLRPLWHSVRQHPGALVSLWSSDTARSRRVRLSVRSAAPAWNPKWVRWTYAVRRVPDIQGGPAPEAQDLLSDDETEVTLLLLPGEQRAANLEFLVALDGYTYSGDYPFDVVATDVESGEVCETPGLLRLRQQNAEWMRYLPALYADPPPELRAEGFAPRESAYERAMQALRYEYRLFETLSFFERFLRGFEDAAEPMQEMLANLDHYFDPDTTPSDCLPWLSTWVALVMDENWPELKRRCLIKEAVELYRWRGTRRGLSRYLEIYTGVKPQINDQPFMGMRLGPNTLLGRDTKLGDVGYHTFVVTLVTPPGKTINEQIARDIIEAEKPAHAAYELRIVQRMEGE
jgi:phage tail-like protein